MRLSHKTLEKHFKPSPEEAWRKYTAVKYTVKDTCQDRNITEYVYTMQTAAQSYKQRESDYKIVRQAWMHYLNIPLGRSYIPNNQIGTTNSINTNTNNHSPQ